MSVRKPSVPRGTRDFSPEVMSRRNFIFDSIIRHFRLHGYLPIETPAMENLDTLLGKYGEEGDKLLFKILNSGDYLSKIRDTDPRDSDPGRLSMLICDRGLRYDLTVPFARYVVQHRNEIVFPFKRYQIQTVWRADKPQKGRYREFCQCDADVIGSDSLLNEHEMIQIITGVFTDLQLRCNIRLNNRRILSGLVTCMGVKDRFADITASLDKLDKIGKERVIEELQGRGMGQEAIRGLTPLFDLKGSNEQKLQQLESMLGSSEEGARGLSEMRELLALCGDTGLPGQIIFEPNLARGLDYYTATIIEVLSGEMDIGSLCGGGRYDDLTGVFGMPGVSGVGISFGADRIYDVMMNLGSFPGEAGYSARLMFVNFGKAPAEYTLRLMPEVRQQGISCELYPDPVKLNKQMSYANSRNIPFVALIGEEEMSKGLITLKDMHSGEQKQVSMAGLIRQLTG